MRLATSLEIVTEENLQCANQIGITDLVVSRPVSLAVQGASYDYERILQLRTQVEATGLRMAAIRGVAGDWIRKMRHGLPGRDVQTENCCGTVENVGRAGVPILGYSFHERIWRTSRHTRGRGGARLTNYDHAIMENAPLAMPTQAGED